MATILIFWITASITFHDFLHGFRSVHGTGTTTLEAKLLQQLASLREEVLYIIFLDLRKASDALDRPKFLEILDRYSVVPRACWLLRKNWCRLRTVEKAEGHYMWRSKVIGV